MSAMSQEPPLESDVKTTTTESRSSLGPQSDQRGQSKAARLRTLRELVRSDGYHISAMLVAERMIKRAVTEDHDHSD